MVMRRASWLVLGAAVVALEAACAQLLGIESIHDDAPDASFEGDAPPGLDAPGSPDAAIVDGKAPGADATSDVAIPPDALPDAPTIDPARGCTGPDGAAVRVFPSVAIWPLGMAIDQNNIYVADMNGVRRCSIEGCDGGVASVLATTPHAFAENGAHVFYSDNQRIYVTSTNGFVVDTYKRPGAFLIATQGADVYWAEPTALGHAVDAPDGNVAVILVEEAGTPEALAADSKYAFFIDYEGDASTGRVVRCAAGDCAGGPVVVATLQGPNAPLAVDETTVYWGDPTAHEIRACDVGGCEAGIRTIATGVLAASLFADPGGVYWTTYDQYGGVFKALPDGAAPVTIAANEHYPSSVVANAACVYWTRQGFPATQAQGSVMATRQP